LPSLERANMSFKCVNNGLNHIRCLSQEEKIAKLKTSCHKSSKMLKSSKSTQNTKSPKLYLLPKGNEANDGSGYLQLIFFSTIAGH
jgi:hypothetical protein